MSEDTGDGDDAGADGTTVEVSSVWAGRRFVLAVYVVIVAITGVFGYVIGLVRPKNLDPDLFGFIDMPPTPTGMALYGMVTIGLLFGLFLYGVSYVSARYDPDAVDGDPDADPDTAAETDPD